MPLTELQQLERMGKIMATEVGWNNMYKIVQEACIASRIDTYTNKALVIRITYKVLEEISKGARGAGIPDLMHRIYEPF
jgi:hypothetical protein